MNEEKWVAWAMQTSKSWSDVEDVLRFTHIDFIDNDHRILIEHALELNHVISKAQRYYSMELIHETKDVLNRFYTYAVEHFNHEEVFMDKYDLPDADAHKREHKRILDILSAALKDFESGKIKVSIKLKMQVMDWLIKHVNIVDYNFFKIEKWSDNLLKATRIEDVKPIIHLTGIGEIDKQHMKLTAQSIEMMNALSRDIDVEEVNDIIDSFIDYTRYHFEFEHQFMLKYKIEDVESHLNEHAYFINKMKTFKHDVIDGQADIHEIKTWLLTWWINHINLTDKSYFDYSNWASEVILNATAIEDIEVVLSRTGIAEVDQDHLGLMEIMIHLYNEINAHSEGKKPVLSTGNGNRIADLKQFMDTRMSDSEMEYRERVLKYLDDAYALAKNHFLREERIMSEIGAHDIVSHKNEHQHILEKLEKIKYNLEHDLLDVSANIKTMILKWWIEHTNTTDFRTFVLRNDEIFK